jgi:putative transposase
LPFAVVQRARIQAQNRTKPLLPMGLGYVEGVTHDYIRHDTTTLVAALDIATATAVIVAAPAVVHIAVARGVD